MFVILCADVRWLDWLACLHMCHIYIYMYIYIYIIAWLYVSFSCLVYLAACIFAIYSSIYLLVHSSVDCSWVPLQAYIHTGTQVLYISSHPPFPEILDGWQFLENSTRARNAPRPNRDLSLNLSLDSVFYS